MTFANRRDEFYNDAGSIIAYRQWPADETGQVDDNGTLRALTADELAEWAAADDEADREADTAALKDDLQNAKNVRDAAIQSRTDMDHETPDPAALAKWAPVDESVLPGLDGTGTNAVRITALELRVDELNTRTQDTAKLANDLRLELRRVYGDIRLISAMLVRKFRKDRDDQ